MTSEIPIIFIWRDENPAPPPNTWTYFRRVFAWYAAQGALVTVAADPTVRIWVNGRLVLDRTQRFVTPHLPLETLDLHHVLIVGINVIVVLHHWWGVPTFQRSPGGAPGFALTGAGVRTDATWQWRNADELTAHAHQTIGHDGSRRIRFPLLLDMGLAAPAIHRSTGDDQTWSTARVVSSPSWSHLVAKETPPLALVAVSPLRVVNLGKLVRESKNATQPHEIGRRMRESIHTPADQAIDGLSPKQPTRAPWKTRVAHGYVTFDFGKPVHGYLRIGITSAPAGAVMEFGYGELASDPRDDSQILKEEGSFDPEFTVGTPFGDHVRLRAGAQTIELPEERTWRWLLIHWESSDGEPITVANISCLTSQHPVIQHGRFDADDARLESIVSLCLDHARITMSDTYVDTTGREDAQWLEDIQYRARLAAQWFGDTTLRQVTLRHAVEQQDQNTGLFRVFAPEDYSTAGCQFLDWGMTWIGLLHDDWQWTGETERVHRYFSALVRFLDAIHQLTTEDGLLTGENCLADLRTSERADYAVGGVESIPNAWYHGYLRQAAGMALAIEATNQAAEWTRQADRLRAGFFRFLTTLPDGNSPSVAETWTPAAGPEGHGQAAAVSAVFFGLLEREQSRDILTTAFTELAGLPPAGMKRWNTPTYIYRVLRCLCEHDMGPIARRHLLVTYEPYLPDGPLPEYFLGGDGQQCDPTGSHGWAAVPLAWMHDTVLGVKWERHGTDAKLVIEPQYAGWDQISGQVATPFGIVRVSVDWIAGNLEVDGAPHVALVKRFNPSAQTLISEKGIFPHQPKSTQLVS
ncbi:MAG: alpha-L-rhamnosidase [Opitutaceae bacterium]|jgi:hypothetical protein